MTVNGTSDFIRMAARKRAAHDSREKGPLSTRIRADIERNILSGKWPPGYRIPFERELVEQYGCSRMTVNKALLTLAANGVITRRRSVGSFVAQPRSERSILEIQDFAREAVRLGRSYRHEIVSRRLEQLDDDRAVEYGMPPAAEVLHIVCVHLFDDEPVAFEDRVISLAKVPEARDVEFTKIPPGTWLLQSVPWTEARHVIRAVNAGPAIAKRLKIEPRTACLVLERQTWHASTLVTRVEITYAGERHRFVGRFSPMGRDISSG